MARQYRRLAACLLFACLGGLAAQEDAAPPSDILIRPVPLYFHFATDAGFDGTQRRLLAESLVMALSVASDAVRLVPSQLESAPASDAELDVLADGAGADAWLDVAIGGSMESAAVSFHARDLANGRDFFRQDISAAIDPRFRDAFGGLWAPVARLIRESIHPYRQFNRLEVQGPAGGVVRLEGQAPRRLDATGTTDYNLGAPAGYAYSFYLPGFRPLSGSLFVENDGSLDFDPAARWPIALSAGVEWLTVPAVSLQADIIPDTLCLELYAVDYALNLDPGHPTDAGSTAARHGLFNLLVGLRWQFLEHRWPLRVSAGAGGQARFLTEGWLRPDPLAPGGWYLLGGVSWDISPELAVFLDHAPRFTWTSDPLLSLGALAGQGGLLAGGLVFAAGNILVEPLHFTLGLRFQP
jgi:hypothetical protein